MLLKEIRLSLSPGWQSDTAVWIGATSFGGERGLFTWTDGSKLNYSSNKLPLAM